MRNGSSKIVVRRALPDVKVSKTLLVSCIIIYRRIGLRTKAQEGEREKELSPKVRVKKQRNWRLDRRDVEGPWLFRSETDLVGSKSGEYIFSRSVLSAAYFGITMVVSLSCKIIFLLDQATWSAKKNQTSTGI